MSSHQSTLGNGFPLLGLAEKASSAGNFCDPRTLCLKNSPWLRGSNWSLKRWGWMEATAVSWIRQNKRLASRPRLSQFTQGDTGLQEEITKFSVMLARPHLPSLPYPVPLALTSMDFIKVLSWSLASTGSDKLEEFARPGRLDSSPLPPQQV